MTKMTKNIVKIYGWNYLKNIQKHTKIEHSSTRFLISMEHTPDPLAASPAGWLIIRPGVSRIFTNETWQP